MWAIIAAVIAVAASAGVYYQQRKMEAQAKKQAQEAKAVQISGHDSNRGLYTVYGKALIGSTTVWKKVSDKQTRMTQTGFTTFSRGTGDLINGTRDLKSNRFLYRAVSLCAGPIQSVENILIDDEGYQSSRFGQGDNRHFAAAVSLGPTAGQNFSAMRTSYSDFNAWGTSFTGKGVAYAIERLYLDNDKPAYQGEPSTKYLVKGRKLYDPRKDSTSSVYDATLGTSSHRFATPTTWEWSDNPVLALLDYMTNSEYGRGLALSVIDLESIADSADKCDVLVDVPARLTNTTGSSYDFYDPESGQVITVPVNTNIPNYRPEQGSSSQQKRFRINIAIDPSKELLDNIQEILNVFRGNLSYANGKYRVHMADVASPVLTIGDDDIITGLKISNGDRTQRMNRATVKFINANKQHKTDQASWPSLDSNEDDGLYNTYVTEDQGEKLHKTFTIKGCTDFYQAQDTAEFLVRDSRSNLTVAGTFGSRCFGLVPGDIVSLTYDSAGYSGKYFRVMQVAIDLNSMNVNLQLKEYDSSVYTWNDDRGNEPEGLTWQEEVVNASPTTPVIGTLSSTTRTRADGSTALTLTVPFSNIPEQAQYVDVEWGIDGTDQYNSQVVFDTENINQVEVPIERDNQTYAVRVRYFIADSAGTLMASTFATDTITVGNLTGTKLGGIAEGATANYIYQQAAEPTGGTYNDGDIWIDTDDNYKFYLRSGGAWVERSDGRIATALANAASAQSTADGKIVTFYQDAEPTTGSEGDLWIDTDADNKLYRYDGSSWTLARDSGIASAINSAATAQATADGKVTTFYAASTATPTPEGTGDLWYQTDTQLFFRYNGSAWQEVASYNTGALADLDTVGSAQIDDGAVGTDQLASSSVSLSKIIEGSVSKVNPVTQTGNIYRWAGYDDAGNVVNEVPSGITVEYDTTEKALELRCDGNVGMRSDTFKIDHNSIYKITFQVKKDAAVGNWYVGAYQLTSATTGFVSDGGNVQSSANFTNYHATTRASTSTSNPYFWNQNATTSYEEFTAYLLGSNVDINEVPAQTTTIIQAADGYDHVGLRILNWNNAGTTTSLFIKHLSVVEMTATTIIADNISTTNLAAINSDLGAITAGSLNINNAFIVTSAGVMTATGATISGGSVSGTTTIDGTNASTVKDGAAAGATALQIGDIAEIISAGNIPTGQLTFNDSGSKTVSYDGNNISVTGGNDNSWDTQVYSSEHYASPCVLQFETTFNSTYRFMMGLNEDPTTNSSYTSIDYAWYLSTSTVTIYENGSQAAPDGGSFSYSVGDKFSIVYDGDNVYYYHNDTLKRTVTGVGAKDFYLDSSLYDTPLTINDVRFAPISRIDYGSIGGVTITPGKLYQGTGTHNNTNTGFYLDSSGKFSLKDKLSFDGTTLSVDGNVTVDEFVKAGSGSTAAVMSGRSADNFAFWAGADFDANGGASGANAPFRVTRAGKVIMTNFALYSTSGQKLFDSTDGLLGLPSTQVAAATGSLVSSVSDELTSGSDYAQIQLSSTQTITVDFDYPLNYLFASGSSEDNAYGQVATSITVTIQKSTDASTWSTFGSVTFNKTDSSSASTSQYYVQKQTVYLGSEFGGGTLYFASLQPGGAVDDGNVLNGNVSASLATGTHYLRMQITYGGSGLAAGGIPSTTAARSITLTTTGAGFTVDSSGNVSDGVATSATTGWVTSNFLAKDSSGNVTVPGNLTVQGDTVQLNTATLNVEDKNIILNYAAGDTSGSADGAGITIQDAVNANTDASLTWNATSDYWNLSHHLQTPSITNSGSISSQYFISYGGQELILAAGESVAQLGSVTGGNPLQGEYVYVVAEGGLQVISSPNNWIDGSNSYNDVTWAQRKLASINKSDGQSDFPAQINVTNHGNSSQWNTAYTYSQVGHLPLAGGTVSGNLTLDNGVSTTLSVKCDDNGLALIRANGDNQGTGAIEVGQSNNYGGGISYNGDGSPAFVSGETSDAITFYRLDNGTRTEVFYYPYSSNNVVFNGSISSGAITSSAEVTADAFVTPGSNANDYGVLRITNPGGAERYSRSGVETGAIKIRLPQTWTNTMLRMTIHVYDYASDESFTVMAGGYTYANGPNWTSTFATIIGSGVVHRSFTVRFAHDGTKCCIFIGELDSTWTHAQIAVTEFTAGFADASESNWKDGWEIDIESTSFGTVSRAISNTDISENSRRLTIAGTEIVDTSRNLKNIASISSGPITLTDSSKMGFGTVKASASVGHTASVDEGIFWHTGNDYGIYRTSGSWTNPDYSQLKIKFVTGIKLDGGVAGQYTHSGVDIIGSSDLQMAGNTVIDASRNIYANYSLLGRGFRAANRGELHLNATGASDVSEIFFGYGNGYAGNDNNIRWGISDRGTTDGHLRFYKGPANSSGGTFDTVAEFSKDTTRLNVMGGYEVNGTTVITSARNATFQGLEGNRIGVNNTSSTTQLGIALYGGYGSATNPTYGLLFTGTAGLGTHGNVTGDWATYFTMNQSSGRGWIFRDQSTPANVASISNAGEATFATVTIDNSAYGSHLILKRSGSSNQALSPSGSDLLLDGGNFGPGVSGSQGLGRSDKFWSHVYSNSYQIGTTTIVDSTRKAQNLSGLSLDSGDGNAIGFWDSTSNYVIYMSSATNSTYGGRVTGESTSDYNMYFKMQSGTNRGFVFRDDANNFFSINPDSGVHSEVPFYGPRLFAPYITGTNGSSSDDILLTRWRYADADSYYLDLHQRVTSSQLRWGFSVHNNGSSWANRLLFKNENVGIGGLEDPEFTLHVNGTTAVDGIIKSRGGHSGTRVHLEYRHSGDDHAYNGDLVLWASEPGISYNNVGIGGNINPGGQYYGRADNNSPYGVYMRFDVNDGEIEFWNTTGAKGTTGGQGTRRAYIDATGGFHSSELEVASILTLGNSSDRSGLLNIVNTGQSWTGVQFTRSAGDHWSVMGNDASFGLYDDENGKWILLHDQNGAATFYHNGNAQFSTQSNGIQLEQFLVANQTSSNRDSGYYGVYSPTRLAHIWSMGTAYAIAADGNSASNIYGLTYSYNPNYGSTGTNPGAISGLDHQMQWRINGVSKVAIGNGIWTAGNVTAYSDRRVKTNIERIPDALNKVCKLNGYTYERTDQGVDEATGEKKVVRQAGVIAQEVLEVLPEVVIGSEELHYSVAYGNMVSLLIEAIKELKDEVDSLKSQLKEKDNGDN